MGLQVALSFNGNCRAALEFYSKVFKFEMPQVMTYGDAHGESDFLSGEEAKQKIMYSEVEIMGVDVMLSDNPPGMEFIVGNNVGLAAVAKEADEIKRLFEELKDGGIVEMELQKTFWSEMFAMVTDRFGIHWQLNLLADQCGVEQ